MSCKILLSLLLILHLVAADNISPEDNTKSELTALAKRKQDLVIELAIFYDTGFDQIFNQDPRKIQQYWEVVMYDLHLRFQTLPSFRVSFRVTSLNVYKNPESESLSLGIENDDEGSYYVNELQKYFQSWLYAQQENIPNFDIAFLITSDRSAVNLITDVKMPDSICRAQDHNQKKWLASAVVSLLTDRSIPEILSQKIASILGAPSDDDDCFWDECDAHMNSKLLCCIMGNTRPNRVARPKFFSNCTDYHLSQKLVSERKSCLDAETAEEDPIIDSDRLFRNPSRLHAYSAVDQCRIFLNDNVTDLGTWPENKQCFQLYCVNKTSNTYVYTFTVLEGTRCGYKGRGRCFRGYCVNQKVNLVNIATGKCLVSERSMFASNDKPILQNCSKVVTQELTGTPVQRWFGKETYVVKVTYSTNDPGVVHEKKLILDNEQKLRFSHKPNVVGTNWVVDIKEVVASGAKEFVLQSENLGPCLKAAEDGVHVTLTTDCSGNDRATRWKFAFPVNPKDVMENIDTFYEIEVEQEVKEIKSVWVEVVTACVIVGVVGFSPVILMFR